ncbi:hypothetical protein WP50_28105, partial [Lactiplantibacillus plantarum]
MIKQCQKANHKWPAKNQRNKVNSKYQILSIQKSMTAVGIMQLVQAGKVKLTDPISKYYPTLKHGRQTTLRQMLDMTTGFRLKSGSKEFLPENQVIDFAAHNVFSQLSRKINQTTFSN